MFFFLTSRSSPRVFFREKDIRLFSVFAFLPLRNRGCHQHVELGVNSPSVHVYLNDFQFICHFASVAVNFECGGLSFFATLSKVEKKLNKIGTLKKFEMRFWKKKKRELLFFRCFSFWQETRDLLLQTDESLQEHRAVVFLHFYYYCWKCSVLYFSIRPWQITKAQNIYYNNCRLLDFALISSHFLNFYFSKNVETKMKKGKAGTSCRNLPFSE